MALLAAGCAPSAPLLPTHGAVGAAMLASPPPGTMRSTGGRLERRGACLVVEAPDGVILPIWPPGTRIRDGKVVTPNLGWRRPPEIGGVIGLEGRYVFSRDGSLARIAGAAAGACATRGFVVERARRIFIADDAVELATDSDAVLLIRVDGVDSAAPGADGHRTTISATVREAWKGGYRPGQALRVRHVYGQGSPLLAHAPVMPRPGETAVLFVNRETYAGQAEARGGGPLPGHVGAGGGLFPVREGRIVNERDIAMPATLAELRALIGR